GVMLALFRARHLLFIYNIDVRNELLNNKSLEDLRALATSLIEDTDAIKVLSTYAINYMYLVDRILFDDSGVINAKQLYELGSSYDTTQPNQSLLLIYLYTHCIIGES